MSEHIFETEYKYDSATRIVSRSPPELVSEDLLPRSRNPAPLRPLSASSCAARPYSCCSLWEDRWNNRSQYPSLLYGQDFGSILNEDELLSRPHSTRTVHFALPLPSRLTPVTLLPSDVSEIVNNDFEYKISLDVHHFLPEEITIRIRDNTAIVTARHEERPDQHGFITREFTRQYTLPQEVDPNLVSSSLNRYGILTIRGPKFPRDRTIPIIKDTMGF